MFRLRTAPIAVWIFAVLLACGDTAVSAPDTGVAVDGGAGDGAAADSSALDAGAVDADVPDGSATDGGSLVDGGGGASALAVLSLNLHCLSVARTRFATNAARFEAIALLVAAEGVDAIAVQESCDDGTTDALGALEAALESATGAAWSRESALAHVAWEGTAEEANESVGLLARGALTDAHTVRYVAQAGLTRVAVSAVLDSGARLMSVHFEVSDADARLGQAEESAAIALALADPSLDVFVAGDFNDRRGTPPHAALVAQGFVDASAELLGTRIDHVFVHRGAALAPAGARLVFTGMDAVSDHPGVLARFSRTTPPSVPVVRVIGRVDVGFGHFVTVRGDTAPLSWARGLPMLNLATDEWRLVATEMDAPFELKLLLDDTTYQMGANVTVTPGSEALVTPAF